MASVNYETVVRIQNLAKHVGSSIEPLTREFIHDLHVWYLDYTMYLQWSFPPSLTYFINHIRTNASALKKDIRLPSEIENRFYAALDRYVRDMTSSGVERLRESDYMDKYSSLQYEKSVRQALQEREQLAELNYDEVETELAAAEIEATLGGLGGDPRYWGTKVATRCRPLGLHMT